VCARLHVEGVSLKSNLHNFGSQVAGYDRIHYCPFTLYVG
jgi:hypothetical protein